MKKISFLTLLCILGTSFTIKAEVKFTGLPEYQVERAKKDQIFDDDYLDYENKADKKVKRQRIEEFYEFFHNNFNLEIDGWKKLSDEAKITKLLDFLTNLSAENKEKIKKADFLTDDTTKSFYVEKYQDEFAEKVADLEGKTEEKTEITYDGKEVHFTRTTYVDENGKRYIKDIYPTDTGEMIQLRESNQPFYDYTDVELYDGTYYVYSSGFSTNGNSGKGRSGRGASLPKGYTVARDRSEHLSDEEKGKLIVIPEDKSLLPDGVEIIDDGRGGKIVKAPESAYKPNGNLNLKPDPTLEKTIEIRSYNTIDFDKIKSTTAIDEFATQEGNISTTYGRPRDLSDINDIYYSTSSIDADNYKTLFQTEDGYITDYEGASFEKSDLGYDSETDEYIPMNDLISKVKARK